MRAKNNLPTRVVAALDSIGVRITQHAANAHLRAGRSGSFGYRLGAVYDSTPS